MRQDQFITHLTVDGRDCGDWDTFDGGETDSEETKYRKAGMPKVSLGGQSEVGNITMERLYESNEVALMKWMRSRAGRGQFVAVRQMLDNDDHAFGEAEVFTGKLKRVQSPASDSNSSDPATAEIELSPDSTVS